MSINEKDTSSCILKAVLELMGNKGGCNITTREISEKAKVNVAAINYYFGSKEVLINKAAEHYYKEMDEIFNILLDNSNPMNKLKLFANKFIEYTLTYLGVQKNLISQAITDDNIKPELAANIKNSMDKIKKVVSESTGIMDEQLLSLKATQFISCLVYPVIMNQYGHEALGMGLEDLEVREKYINMLVDNII
jgi:TetR/AcrR family transcriptional regulator, regulator of cefoperazone and chloramphenicol sensitivity